MGKSEKNIIRTLFMTGFILLSGFILFTGCKKSGTNCITNAGPVVREVREIADFDSIEMNDYVNLILTQDSVVKVEVETGKNLQSGIETTVTERQLIIRNNNVCNWLRSYSTPVNVYVTVDNLKKIFYNSSGNITTTNPITSKKLTVDVWGGAGTIDMNLDIKGFGYFIVHQGTADLKLRGNCSICSIYSGEYGLIHAGELHTGYSFVSNHGSNDVYVKAIQYLSATIESIGNIYYTGNPDSLDIVIKGPGQVIPY